MTEFVPGGGDDELTIPLDTFTVDDLLLTYPWGFSIMGISDASEWSTIGSGPGNITTIRTDTYGWQLITDRWGFHANRVWDVDDDNWLVQTSSDNGWLQYSLLGHDHTRILPLQQDAFDEADLITDYADGFSALPVSAGANWGPNTGQAGIVETTRNGSNGTQTFTQYSNGNKFSRGYASGAWSAWVALQ